MTPLFFLYFILFLAFFPIIHLTFIYCALGLLNAVDTIIIIVVRLLTILSDFISQNMVMGSHFED